MMEYYKNQNNNIYYGDKSNSDIELSGQELTDYLFAQAKENKLNQIKQKAYSIITEKFPEWKQINMTADREFALGYIAKLRSKLKEEVNNDVIDKIINKTIPELVAIYNDHSLLDITDINDIPLEYSFLVPQIRAYYYLIAEGFIVYMWTNGIRIWSDTKEEELNNAVSIEQINSIDLEDYIRI